MAEKLAERIEVWPLKIRIFHWSLVVLVFSAYFTAEDTVTTHQLLGYLVLTLVIFRIGLGLISKNEFVNFFKFLPTWERLNQFLKELSAGRERRYLGHNPASAVMIFTILGLLLIITTTGILVVTELIEEDSLIKEIHEISGNAILFLIPIHVAGAIFTSIKTKENLIKAMFTGRKRPE